MTPQLSIFAKIFVHYIKNMKGSILIISNDSSFIKLIRSCYKNAGLADDALYSTREFPNLIKLISNILTFQKHVVLMMEKSIYGKSSLDDIGLVKEKFGSQLKVIVVSAEVEGNAIAFMYEKGADNVIIKPIAQNNLIQKISTVLTPNNALDELIEGCKRAFLKNDLDMAEDYTEKILEVRPDSAMGFMLKGDVYLMRSEFDKACYFYTQATASSKYYLEPWKKLVKLAEIQNNLEQKLKYLKILDTISPLNRERKIEIANDMIRLGDVETAYAYYEQAISIARREANEVLSKTYMEISSQLKEVNYNKCLEYSSKAIRVKGKNLSKDDVWMFNDKGIYLRKHGKNDEAVKCFQSALKIAPDDPVINYNLGMAYADEKEVALAAGCFDTALDNDQLFIESNPSAAYNIGVTYYNARRFEDAHRMFSVGLKNDPENKQLQNMLENTYNKINY